MFTNVWKMPIVDHLNWFFFSLNFVATVIRNGVEIDIKCENILQGDLVKASRDCDVPCDIVLLKTSDPDAKCYVTTANLDGETNLKTLFVPKGFPNEVSIGKYWRFVYVFFSILIILNFLPQKNFIILVQLSVINHWLICIHSMDDWKSGRHFFGVKIMSPHSVIHCGGIEEHYH